MSQVNVNTPRNDGDGGAAAAGMGMGMGMIMMLVIGLIVLLLVAYFLLRPMFSGGPANVNVNIRSSDVLDGLRLLA